MERITALLGELGNPHRAFRCVHVAGTNGKGSTCALLESALRAAGQRTALFTSPHLVEPTERIRVAGAPVTAAAFAAAFDTVHATAERMIAAQALDMHPTYFETITAMAFLLFRDQGVEMAVLETGMGGRLDSTNVVDPELAVVTPIDFDHEQYLGDTIPKIAAEKAGIIKPGRPVVVSRQRPDALAVLERRAAELGAPLHRADGRWRTDHLEVHPLGSVFHLRGPRTLSVECPLVGVHQVENTLTALTALDLLGVPDAAITDGIRTTVWPGRLERVRSAPDTFLDGAHNPAGARALAAYIRHFHHHRRVWLVFGAMRDKSVEEIGHLLFPLAAELICTAPAQARALAPEEIRARSGRPDARVAPHLAAALELVQAAAPGDVIFITGSLYLVGEARAALVA